jgi:subtilase family serine protease
MKSLIAIFLAFAIPSATVLAAPRVQLAGHVPKIVESLTPTGRLPGDTRLNLAIGLPLHNQDTLSNLMEALYDPASPQYHQYLTPDQFTETFGPTVEDYDALVNFVTTNGFTVTATHSDRMLLEVSAAATDIERAFQITLRLYKHPREARSFYAPDSDPTVPEDLQVADISGLNNFLYPHPKNLNRRAAGQLAKNTSMDGSGPAGNLLGSDFRNAYAPGVTNTGAGQIVGLFEFDGYYTNDIATYASQAGYATVPPITNLLLAGFPGVPGNEDSEVALDIEMTLAMAPGLSEILVYETSTNTAANVILSAMATNTAINQFSCSWNFNNVSNPRSTMDGYFMKMITQGQSFFNASGDDGAYPEGTAIVEPDDDPYITVVGGTALFTGAPGGSWDNEVSWNTAFDIVSYESDGSSNIYAAASGGGISTTYVLPSWQTGVSGNGNGASTSHRNVPDVSMAADNIFLVADDGEAEIGVGTSCSAPLWCAFTALVNQQAHAKGHAPVGFINPAIYALYKSASYASTFDDITSGNDTNGDTGFFATTGYDLCTGLGSPTGSSLIVALAAPDGFIITPGRGSTANGPTGGPFNVSTQTVILTNSGATNLNWSLGGAPTWLSVSTNGGTLTAGGLDGSVTVSLNALANGMAAGVYTANIWFTNLTSGEKQLRQLTLQVNQNLVHDGSFESGDFCYWNLTGLYATFYNFVDNGDYTPYSPPSGLDDIFFAAMGESNGVANLSQELPTRQGQSYQISFWLQNQTGLNPTEFIAQFGTNILSSRSDMPAFDWTQMQYTAVASSNTTLLEFGFRDDQDYLVMDDVSVIPLPSTNSAPVTPPTITSVQRVGQTIEITWTAVSGQIYEVQSATNLLQTNWSVLGSQITATASTATSPAEPIGSGSTNGFYRVVLLP